MKPHIRIVWDKPNASGPGLSIHGCDGMMLYQASRKIVQLLHAPSGEELHAFIEFEEEASLACTVDIGENVNYDMLMAVSKFLMIESERQIATQIMLAEQQEIAEQQHLRGLVSTRPIMGPDGSIIGSAKQVGD